MEERIADLYNVIAGIALTIAGIFLGYDGGTGSRIWGALMILLGVVMLILNMLGMI